MKLYLCPGGGATSARRCDKDRVERGDAPDLTRFGHGKVAAGFFKFWFLG
jgi:hypothetical protein